MDGWMEAGWVADSVTDSDLELGQPQPSCHHHHHHHRSPSAAVAGSVQLPAPGPRHGKLKSLSQCYAYDCTVKPSLPAQLLGTFFFVVFSVVPD